MSVRRNDRTFADDENVCVIGFRDKAVNIEHDGAVGARDIRFNRCKDVIE